MSDRWSSRAVALAAGGAALALVLGTAGGAVAGRLVTGKDIKDGSITGADVKSHSLRGDDLRKGSVGGKQLGRAVHAGIGRVDGYATVSQAVTVPPQGSDYYQSTTIDVPCPHGTHVLSGGYDVGSINSAVVVAASSPAADGSGWHVFVHNPTTVDVTATAFAVCGRTRAPRTT